jgi:hypothetical protein
MTTKNKQSRPWLFAMIRINSEPYMKTEYKHAIVISLLIILLVNLPLIYFSFFPKDELVFLGRRVINSQDLYTYLSYIEQSKTGSIFLQNMYTTEPQTATLVRPSYVLIGKVARLLDLTPIVAYHGARVLFSFLFCFVLFCFIKNFFEKQSERLLAFVIVLLSSGWGAFLYKFFNSSDLWIPESNTFLSLGESPHFILTQTLMLCAILLFVKYVSERKIKYCIGVFLCLFPIAFEHPFDLLVIVPTLFISIWWHKKKFPSKGIVLLCALCLSGLSYAFLQQYLNPLFAKEQLQGASISPAPLYYLIGYGFLIPLAIRGGETVFTSKNIFWKICIVWVFLGAIALYAPVTFQRRMSEGLHIPIALLASLGIFSLYREIYPYMKQITRPIFISFFLLLFATSFSAIYNDFITIRQNTTNSYYYYISKGDADALKWLSENSNASDYILTNWFYGNLIPGMMPRKVYLGHTAQTITFADKVTALNTFLLDTNILSGSQFLKDNHISYIFLGSGDSMLQYGFKPDERAYLEKVYSKDDVFIYKVK